ncbi:uncharacterized protein LOC112051204 [Bicyclus anynana]|uniref:Uncharacterized protein LOC112051204 n=1 Tax=Bicyclus anynana TaxID=110368 RepID=A0ABM3LMD9_BICAN|nr:uncharacterized protein LOC112051204 [Bicyclus anynana]XP_052740214.1 uncharacterized protein LOC112051204 [Bicyclus anynana]
MTNCWIDEYTICRDLSLAQGKDVPVEIDRSVTVAENEPPPALNITEDTEEEFFGPYVGDGDTNCGPDLHLITQMLKVVNPHPDGDSPEEPPSPSLAHTSLNMFKRKENNKPVETSPTVALQPKTDTVAEQPRTYVPSARAAEYYKKFSEQSQALEQSRDTIWSRLERQMREIDEKRRQNTLDNEQSSSSAGTQGSRWKKKKRKAVQRMGH